MGPKILWVLLPLAVYAALLALVWRGKAPSRLALNVHSSLLLMAYLLTTAGLGLFWVANQQLPVFDWHYLFGYTTLLLVCLHLFFNLPVAWRWLRQRHPAATPPGALPGAGRKPGRARQVVRAAAAVGVVLLAFAVGTHWGGRSAGPALPAAAGPDAGPAGDIATVLRYHAASSSSRSAVFGRAPVVDWGDQPAPFKTYPAAPQVELPRAVAGDGEARSVGAMLSGPSAPAALDLAAVGRLLHLTAGVTARRGGLSLRAAPSSGALFPAELYLVARRVEGLQAGLYHFDAERHRLARLGELPAAHGAGDGADLSLVVAAVFQRTGYKYRNRAYRYVAADLGHLLENARLAGHYVGARSVLLDEFDEMALARDFGLDGGQEGVLAVVAYSRASDTPPTPAAHAGSSGLGVTGEVHAATSRGRVAGGGKAGDGAAGRGAQSGGGGGLVVLPRGEAAAMDLARAILQRRSQRRFTAQPVPLQQLASLLAEMAQPPLLSGALHADLVISRVDGVRAGVYRYLPAQHALQPVALGDFATNARNAALDQDVIGDAAVVLILSADSGQALRNGARGYRMAFLEAGLMGERWLLGAVARGLGACPVGAFYDEEAAQLVKAPEGRWVLHFAALGQLAPD
ncbi:SagB/ThcOx family dehydrogenase [Pseudoduganella sp. OTU4001]|uniref:SagB/ThcOx family dehydrogenase n=1 Tax=Pseudoduganella sp. OTU4001 TaxID=3043854 RepID=UPI00313C4184